MWLIELSLTLSGVQPVEYTRACCSDDIGDDGRGRGGAGAANSTGDLGDDDSPNIAPIAEETPGVSARQVSLRRRQVCGSDARSQNREDITL